MRHLKAMFGKQIQLKWNHCLLRIKMLNIYLLCVIDIFAKHAWVKPSKIKKVKQFLMLLWQQKMDPIVNQVNYGLIRKRTSQ